jgi:hypothetical protein
MHGYVPYHTQEYLARQGLNRKERVVQGASRAVSNKGHHQKPEVALPNASSSVPPPAPKLPEVAYHDDFWKVPVGFTPLNPPQPQGVPQPSLFFPFETQPGYGAPNAIQTFPSVAQSPPSLTPSDFTINNYSDLHGPQPYTMQSQEQQFGESLTGDHNIPPYNGNGLWNWPLQNWPLQY